MAYPSLSLPVLANNPRERVSGIKTTIAEMTAQVDSLRSQKAIAQSEEVYSLHMLLGRLRGQLARLELSL